MAEVLLAFGANLGEPAAAIRTAMERLEAAGIAILARSSLYRTAPWGPVVQPDFINACALARTDLSPRDLLEVTQRIERELGRGPGPRWGPRIIDIDLLDYDDRRIDEPGLRLPHPRLTERAFVLVPLAEIAAERLVAGRRVADWLAEVTVIGVEKLDGSPAEIG